MANGKKTATTAAETLKEGDLAPEIQAHDDRAQSFALSKLRGSRVILYFYPKADTPGCTKESCEFRDRQPEIAAEDTVIIGVSPDKSTAQAKFKSKFSLPFTLLADEDHQIAETYGVWKEKSMYGRKYMGVERTTFLIGKDGRIRRIFRAVKPEGHAAQVLAALRES